MRVLGSLGRREVKVAVPAAVQAVAAAANVYRGQPFNYPYTADWDMLRAVREGMERSVWVFRAVHAMATDMSRLPVVVRDGDPTSGVEVTDHPILPLLNQAPNRLERSARAFKYRAASQLLLSKRGVFIEVIPSNGGWPAELYLLPPHLTTPIPHPTELVSGFRVVLPGTPQGFIDLPPEQVVWVKWDHPTDAYASLTPLEAAGISIDTDYYARMYNRNFLINDGRPGGILSIGSEVDDEDAEELSKRFGGGRGGRGGPDGAGRISVIEASDVNFVDTAVTPRDAQYIQSRNITKEDILIAFGVPESRAGNASGRTFDNADAEIEIYWLGTELPFVGLFEDAFNQLTEPGQFPVYDVDGVPTLQRVKRAADAALQAEVDHGVRTPAEYRRDSSASLEELTETEIVKTASKLYYMGKELGTVPAQKTDPQLQDIAAPSALPLPPQRALAAVKEDPAAPEGSRDVPFGPASRVRARRATP